MTPGVDDLLHERAIHRALCRFAEAMDRRDWAMLDDVLLIDATGDFGEGFQPRGRPALIELFQHFLGRCGPTQHLIGNLVVEITGERASSRCYVRDMHQGAGARAALTFSSPGIYDDQWILTPEGWRIAHRSKTNLMMIGSIAALGADD